MSICHNRGHPGAIFCLITGAAVVPPCSACSRLLLAVLLQQHFTEGAQPCASAVQQAPALWHLYTQQLLQHAGRCC
jgi:hypothetical protein